MTLLIAAALAAAQPAVVQTAPVPAPNPQMRQMGQAGPKKEECCCKDKMGKEQAMNRMQGHQGRDSR